MLNSSNAGPTVAYAVAPLALLALLGIVVVACLFMAGIVAALTSLAFRQRIPRWALAAIAVPLLTIAAIVISVKINDAETQRSERRAADAFIAVSNLLGTDASNPWLVPDGRCTRAQNRVHYEVRGAAAIDSWSEVDSELGLQQVKETLQSQGWQVAGADEPARPSLSATNGAIAARFSYSSEAESVSFSELVGQLLIKVWAEPVCSGIGVLGP